MPNWLRETFKPKERNVLDSVKIQRRQSEIRQKLAELVGKEKPSDDETRAMECFLSTTRIEDDPI